ncbi:MAG: TRAP transporter fused permease subunit [Dialister sp.]|nr:TRAP transporter fused permease subunit [Dialister sp.]
MTQVKRFRMAAVILFFLWTAYQIIFTTVLTLPQVIFRSVHCAFLFLAAALLYPVGKWRGFDLCFAVLGVSSFLYLALNYNRVAETGGRITSLDGFVAAVGVLCAFEAARRVSKNLTVLALLFFAYNWIGAWLPAWIGHNGFTLKRVLITQFWGTGGLLGTGAGVSATYIFIFILFGSFLKHSGFSSLISDVALTLVGRSPGGPAKVAVIASGLMGMINGSAIANVAATGTVTIPLMKRAGYRKEFAAAVEAAASTGGQFTPPVMGAVAFVMAEFLNMAYAKVALAAVIPAFLYYAGLLFAVHLEAKKQGLSGLSYDHIPPALFVLKERGHLALPMICLVVLMALGYSPVFAATVSLLVTFLSSWLRRDTRMGGEEILQAVSEGAAAAVPVGLCCVIIGIIIGTVTLTSLGLNMGYLIMSFTGSHAIYIAGALVMVMAMILGMGVPGVAAYVIVSAVAVPVLVKAGAQPLPAHFFCLIYASLSNITPPVALSSYVASGIAGAGQLKTSLLSMRLGLTGFILPFFFLGNPVLLLADPSVGAVAVFSAFGSAFLGTLALTAALEGELGGRLSFLSRALLILACPFLLQPGLATDGIGIAIIGAAGLMTYVKRRKS